MFSIAEQTITEPTLQLTMAFGCDPADYSNVTLEISCPPGVMHLVFNRGGNLVSHTLVEKDKDPVLTTYTPPVIPDPSDRPAETGPIVSTETLSASTHVDGDTDAKSDGAAEPYDGKSDAGPAKSAGKSKPGAAKEPA